MKTHKNKFVEVLAACLMMLSLPVTVHAWQPNAKELDAAINAGDLSGYFANISTWLDQNTPADPGKITEAAMTDLIKDPVFRNTLDQRQFMVTHGLKEISAFAKVEAHRAFLAWIMKSTEIMDQYLEAGTPTGDQPTDVNEFKIDTGALARWHKIYTEDPDSRNGIYLRLGMAFAIWPPGGTGYGSGLPIEWFPRYKHYKAAHQNKELVPSFDKLPVCDYGSVIGSWGSDRDLAWGRQIFRCWRPDLLDKEQIPKIVSEVWRRFSPFPFSNGFVTVMEGGGKCGPRGFFGCFICQANGIPAIGVGQPAHCCFAAKSAYPELEPQPGSVWKVWQGRGWHVSDCGGCGGPQFLAEKTKRYRVAELSQIAHLRWVALTVSSKERVDAVRTVVGKIRKPVNTSNPLGVPSKDIDAIAWGPPATIPALHSVEEPFKVAPGVIHVEAETFTESFADPLYPAEQEGHVYVYDCFTGGKQVNFARNMKISWIDYSIDVPEAGTYAMEIMVAAANRDQVLDVSCGTEKLGTIKIPGTTGLWKKMEPVDINLKKGPQSLKISAPLQRGVAIRWFELTPKK
ncbi:MAG: carbohydrate-binding protein [Planctomycetota bacterium]